MQQYQKLEMQLERIKQMEVYFGTASAALTAGKADGKDPVLGNAIHRLAEYMASGAWLEDYQLDEKGMIPAEIKRGVLSQDGLYNALCELKRLLKR